MLSDVALEIVELRVKLFESHSFSMLLLGIPIALVVSADGIFLDLFSNPFMNCQYLLS
jgi:hypothetical protein